MKATAYIGTARRVASARMPTRWGMFRALGFERDIVNGVHQVDTALALVLGDVTTGVPLVRIHSQCVTGEMLGSLRCDCGDQLEMAMQAVAEEGRGLLIYEYQEGRGIGLSAKLQAYALQDSGLDTVEANHALGFAADCRDFSLPAAILHDLGLNRIRLLSNNRHKIDALVDFGIDVVAQVPCEAKPTPHSIAYLRTKKEKMGHALSLGQHETTEYDEDFEFASIEEAIGELQAGRMIVVVDDEDRENEGDLTMAAEMITPEAVNFIAMHGRGLICLAMTGDRLDDLELTPMAPDNTALGGTAFTVSIDVKGPGVTTGISAGDRAQTILAVTEPSSRPDDFARPGACFPASSRGRRRPGAPRPNGSRS
jgi:GTP cyclohydrolase II